MKAAGDGPAARGAEGGFVPILGGGGAGKEFDAPTLSAPGGGGIGGNEFNVPTGSAGTPNTGGGGGGAFTFAKGGSGIVKIRYTGTPIATGGTITTVGAYTYHTFNSSSNFVIYT